MNGHNYQADFLQSETPSLELEDAVIDYRPGFIEFDKSIKLYEEIVSQTPWRQEMITVYGKEHLTPRLSCWMGNPEMVYSYSNTSMAPVPWSASLLKIKRILESSTKKEFNSVLINYYRDGQDSVGWHSDDEPELGVNPVIASISLGASRDFHLRHKFKKQLRHKMSLNNGSLLIMSGATQRSWQHQVPKCKYSQGRINLTFRTIYPPNADQKF